MPLPVIGAAVAALGATGVALVTRVLLGLGLSVVTYVGISTLWDSITDQIWANLGAGSASVLTILGMARVDDGLQVILSVASSILVIRGLGAAGALRFLRWSPPA